MSDLDDTKSPHQFIVQQPSHERSPLTSFAAEVYIYEYCISQDKQ